MSHWKLAGWLQRRLQDLRCREVDAQLQARRLLMFLLAFYFRRMISDAQQYVADFKMPEDDDRVLALRKFLDRATLDALAEVVKEWGNAFGPTSIDERTLENWFTLKTLNFTKLVIVLRGVGVVDDDLNKLVPLIAAATYPQDEAAGGIQRFPEVDAWVDSFDDYLHNDRLPIDEIVRKVDGILGPFSHRSFSEALVEYASDAKRTQSAWVPFAYLGLLAACGLLFLDVARHGIMSVAIPSSTLWGSVCAFLALTGALALYVVPKYAAIATARAAARWADPQNRRAITSVLSVVIALLAASAVFDFLHP